MPAFLEAKLKKEYSRKGLTGKDLDHAIYGTMNKMGAMQGSQITEKGREMEAEHEAGKRKAKAHMAAHAFLKGLRGK